MEDEQEKIKKTEEDPANESIHGLRTIVVKLEPALNPYVFVFEMQSSGFLRLVSLLPDSLSASPYKSV